MKKLPIISLATSIVALIVACVLGIIGLNQGKAPKTATAEKTDSITSNVAYFQLDRIMTEYDMATDTLSALQTIQENVYADLQRREAKINKDANDLNDKMQKGLIIRSSYETQAQKIQRSADALQRLANEKQQELQERQAVAMNVIIDAIKTYVDAYNADGKFEIIIANQGGSPVFTGDPGLDITQDIIDGLNEEYLKVKNKKR